MKSLCKVVFFFSSRRRHTRSYGDWSSDVCSSDLGSHQEVELGAVFSARIGHREGSAAAWNSRGGARISREFDGDVLPGNFARLPAALGTVFRTVFEWAAWRLPGHRYRYLRRPP